MTVTKRFAELTRKESKDPRMAPNRGQVSLAPSLLPALLMLNP